MTMDEFTNQHLAGSVGVHVRGVDEIPARRAVGLINLAGFVFSGTPTPILAKCHGAERHFCKSQTAIPQESIFHSFDLSSRNFGSHTIVQWIRSQELALQNFVKKTAQRTHRRTSFTHPLQVFAQETPLYHHLT